MTEKIIEIITNQLMPDSEITLASSMTDDLGADSLDIVEIMLAIEEEFNVNIPDEVLIEFKSVGDLVAYVEEHA